MNLNERIAKGKGWKYSSMFHGWYQGKLVDNSFKREDHLNYTKDPKLILELVLELLEKGWVPFKFSNSMYGWAKKEHLFKQMPNVREEDFGIATAMAWLEEFK